MSDELSFMFVAKRLLVDFDSSTFTAAVLLEKRVRPTNRQKLGNWQDQSELPSSQRSVGGRPYQQRPPITAYCDVHRHPAS